MSPAEYTVPPIPTESTDERVPLLAFPPVQERVDSPVRECSPLPLASSGGVNIRPTSPSLLPSGRLADAPDPPPRHMATMDQYLPREQPVQGVESSYPPVLQPMTSEPMVEVIVVESAMDSTSTAGVVDCAPVGPDVSREGPFDVHQLPPVSGTTPWVLDSLPGCQYRMTSYDEKDTGSDVNPAYGIHLHNPCLLEYVGMPESA